MLLLWLATVLVSISPEIHHLLHQDSHNAKHECLVTQVSKGQVLLLTVVGFIIALPTLCEHYAARDLVFARSVEYGLSPTRGPPVR